MHKQNARGYFREATQEDVKETVTLPNYNASWSLRLL